jgi:hypothetical protein
MNRKIGAAVFFGLVVLGAVFQLQGKAIQAKQIGLTTIASIVVCEFVACFLALMIFGKRTQRTKKTMMNEAAGCMTACVISVMQMVFGDWTSFYLSTAVIGIGAIMLILWSSRRVR